MLLLVALLGIALIALIDDWRLGVRVIGGALLAIGALRMLLPERDAGMLAVRSRPVDVALVVVAGIALFVLASSIPDQPPLP